MIPINAAMSQRLSSARSLDPEHAHDRPPPDLADRIRHPALRQRIVSAETAAALIGDGMVVGMSGFTKAGDAKAVPLAMAARARRDPFKITLITGASLGHDIDRMLTEAGVLARRLPFQADPTLRKAINRGEVMFIDQHLSETVEHIRSRQLGPIDYAIVEAAAITEDGCLVPTTSIGNSASFAMLASKIIVEINLSQPLGLDGLHDIYIPTRRPARDPIPVTACDSRVGLPFVPVSPDRIAAIVITNESDSAAVNAPADSDTGAIAQHLIALLETEVAKGRLDLTLQPLQAGIGSIANSVLRGLAEGPFHHLGSTARCCRIRPSTSSTRASWNSPRPPRSRSARPMRSASSGRISRATRRGWCCGRRRSPTIPR